MRKYKTRSGKVQCMPSIKQLEKASASGTEGYCLAYGRKAYGVEPDAVRYTCKHCGKAKVYGADELALRGICY